jgi:YHS domain-containing protein
MMAGLMMVGAVMLTARAVNTDEQGLAIKGYDPVAYFVAGGPAEGSAEFEWEWQGATWRFTSAANQARFAADPVKYAPQYGGYCAWAVSNNYTAPVDPEAWKIVAGKLYLNYNRDVQARWEKEMSQRIKQADAHWPELREN